MSHASLQIIFTCPISLIFPPLLNGETEAWDLRKRTHVPVVNRRQSQHCSFLHVRRTSLGQLNVVACIVHSDVLISFLGHSVNISAAVHFQQSFSVCLWIFFLPLIIFILHSALLVTPPLPLLHSSLLLSSLSPSLTETSKGHITWARGLKWELSL